MKNKITETLLTITEGGMLFYWCFATLVVLDLIYVEPEMMYSDYKNPLIVSWNWSFFPLDMLFAIVGLLGRFSTLQPKKKETLSVVSLSLMFCAGLIAVPFGQYEEAMIFLWLSTLLRAGFSGNFA